MSITRVLGAAFYVLFSAAGVLVADVAAVQLPFRADENNWQFKQDGLFEGWIDHRDLGVLHHPWAASETGRFCLVYRDVSIPQDWTGAVRLHFYMTDDYYGDQPNLEKGSWVGQIKLVGHRFKEVLVDDEVVWQRDVADADVDDQPRRFTVVLPKRLTGGSHFRLGFRMIDKVGSAERLPNDFRLVGTTDGIKETDEWKFATHLYVGDVALTPANVESLPAGHLPSDDLVRKMREKQWPLPPYGKKVQFPVALDWEFYDKVSPLECVISCGLPLPFGLVHDAGQIAILDGNKKPLPVQIRKENEWEDGSWRWFGIDAIAQAGTSNAKLFLNISDTPGDAAKVDEPVTVVADKPNVITISTGDMKVVLDKQGDTLLRQWDHGDVSFGDLKGEIQIGDAVYRPVIEEYDVLSKGPIRGEVELRGQLKSEKATIGPFVFRLAAFAGQPYLRMTWRIFNLQHETLKVSRFELIGRSDFQADAVTRWGVDDKQGGRDVCLSQVEGKKYSVTDKPGSFRCGRICIGLAGNTGSDPYVAGRGSAFSGAISQGVAE